MSGATGRIALAAAALVVVLTVLLLGSAEPDADAQARRLAALDSAVLNQAALHRDVLRARAGLLRNYDPLAAAVAGLREAVHALEADAQEGELGERRAALAAQVEAQDALVEDFKSINALLQNSLAYFAYLSARTAAEAGDPALAAAVGAAANAMLHVIGEPSDATRAAAAAALTQLDMLRPAAASREEAASLAAHGRLIISLLPNLDALLAALLAARTADEAYAMQGLFVDAYHRVAMRAWLVRIALYATSLLLLAYLVALYLQLRAQTLARERAAREREALEHRLQQAERMEAIGRLAGGIAHDFNNILGAILGYAELALARLPPGGRAWRHVREVGRAGRRGKAVVDQILAFGRPSPPERRPVRIAAALEEACALLRAALPATVAFDVKVEAGDLAALVDPTQLQQVMLNLCTNAAQAMDENGTVAIAAEAADREAERVLSHGTLAAGPYVRVTVRDDGCGIDRAALERIFEPFFTTKARGEGTGLGLATVHAIVAEHRGAMDVHSVPGAGSSFAVYLPRAAAPPAAAQPGAEPGPHGHGETILLVDESALVTQGEEMLAGLGYEPVGFHGAAAALAALREDPLRFDLVLADADVAGGALAAAVHALRPELPVMLMARNGARASHPGVAAVVAKPLSAPVLAPVLAQVLGRVLARSLRPLQT